jgi:ABC-type glycerol-3-phosphate transport system permease component
MSAELLAPPGTAVETQPRRLARRRIIRHPGRLAAYPLLLAGVVLAVAPLWWMFAASFMDQGEIFSGKLALWPTHWIAANYVAASHLLPLYRNLLNSLIIAGGHTLLAVFFASLAGYAFAKMEFPGRGPLFLLILLTMMVPPEVGLIPSFVIMARLHLVNTYWALIIPGAASGLGIFFMRQYISTLPNAVLEAAQIDGCPAHGIFWRIILPMSGPALAALAILDFVGSWNDYLWPLVMLRTQDMQTITLAVPALEASGFNTPWGAIMAGSVVAVLPPVLIFLVFQRYFVAGVTLGGVKE